MWKGKEKSDEIAIADRAGKVRLRGGARQRLRRTYCKSDKK
jgi:hypothetical protein